MIKHIVQWKLKDEAHGNTKQVNAIKIKEMVENLKGLIPGIISIEVGIDFSNQETSSDVVLYSEFVSKEALDNYQVHPEHKAVVPFISEAVKERRLVDYEV